MLTKICYQKVCPLKDSVNFNVEYKDGNYYFGSSERMIQIDSERILYGEELLQKALFWEEKAKETICEDLPIWSLSFELDGEKEFVFTGQRYPHISIEEIERFLKQIGSVGSLWN